jgi:SSS family solute:Na+ symporter
VQAVLTVIIIAAYLAVLTFVALRARAAGRFEEFSVARRCLPLPLIFGSLAATYIGPAFSLGFVGKGFHAGYFYFFIALATPLQYVLVGLGVASRLRQCRDCHTLGDVMRLRYNRTCQFFAGIISVGLCAGVASIGAKVGGHIVTALFDISLGHAVVIMVTITAIYTTMGGLRASVITDAFQFTTFVILLPLVCFWVITSRVDGAWDTLVTQAMEATHQGLQQTSGLEILGLVMSYFLGEALIPPYANRALASSSTAVSRRGFLLGGAFCVVWFVVMFSLGIAARAVVPSGCPEDEVLLSLVRLSLPNELYALMLVILISIVMSTMDSVLNAGAVSFTQDIVKPFFSISDEKALKIGRLATLCIAALAALFALRVENIIKGLLYCYTTWAPAILPALIAGLWLKRPAPLAGLLSMLTGTGVSLLANTLIARHYQHLDSAVAILPALLASVGVYVLGHFISQHRQSATTEADE